LVRHGQTEANLRRRYQGRGDSPLTQYGEQQMQAMAMRLRSLPFDVALISPTARTRAMAEAILARRTGVQASESAAWAETNHGRWEGLTYREVLAQFPAEARARWAEGINGRAEGGESLVEVAARVQQGWRDLLEQHPGGRVLISTHATPVQLVLCAAFSLPPTEHWRWRIDLGSVTCLDVYAAGPIVRMVNEVPKLLQ
jgi:2,3-bisphosphoglycerate-dependent phosphoglycerate mutase/probable phosphoglycerate mutase